MALSPSYLEASRPKANNRAELCKIGRGKLASPQNWEQAACVCHD
jgi:hypothetical protein